MLSSRDDCIIVGGSGNKELAEEVAALLGCKLANIETGKFKDGETFVKVGILDEVRRQCRRKTRHANMQSECSR